jgi:hypothetical protein
MRESGRHHYIYEVNEPTASTCGLT